MNERLETWAWTEDDHDIGMTVLVVHPDLDQVLTSKCDKNLLALLMSCSM